jgi:hypothetical protein
LQKKIHIKLTATYITSTGMKNTARITLFHLYTPSPSSGLIGMREYAQVRRFIENPIAPAVANIPPSEMSARQVKAKQRLINGSAIITNPLARVSKEVSDCMIVSVG